MLRARIAVISLLAAAVIGAIGDYFLVTETPAEAPTTAPIALTPPPADSQARLILELFNPNDPLLQQPASLATFRQKSEQVLISSFVLKRCGKLSDQQYRDIFRALHVYAQQTPFFPEPGALSAELNQRVTSAQTAYSLVYRRVDCGQPELAQMLPLLTDWLSHTLPPGA